MVNRDKRRGVLPSSQVFYAAQDIYDVPLSEEQAASILTVGDLFDHIQENFSTANQEGCLRSIAFYKLRRALVASGVPRDFVKRDALLSTLLPRNDRQRHWQELRDELCLSLPDLHFPGWLESIFMMVAVIAGITIIASPIFIRQSAWAVLFLLGGIAVALVLKWVQNRRANFSLAVEIPPGFETVGDMVSQIVAWNFSDLAKNSNSWNSKELFQSMQYVIAYICAAKPEDIRVDTKFTELPDFE